MAHAHIVKDSDNHFIIDPITRQLSSNSKKTILIKTDHNSEQFTFELPRYVEGHDMSTCNKVEVHFLNINSKTRQTNPGIYNVVDFAVDAEDNTKVLGTWLVSREATKYPGSLNFVIRFACMADGNTEDYSWNTAIYTGITITDGICNTETVTEEYVDIFRQWLDALELAAGSSDVYAITDDGTFINLCEQINGVEAHVTELEGQIDGYEEQITNFDNRVASVEQDVSTFKEDTNTSIDEFKTDTNTKITAFEQDIQSKIDEYGPNRVRSLINQMDDAETDIECLYGLTGYDRMYDSYIYVPNTTTSTYYEELKGAPENTDYLSYDGDMNAVGNFKPGVYLLRFRGKLSGPYNWDTHVTNYYTIDEPVIMLGSRKRDCEVLRFKPSVSEDYLYGFAIKLSKEGKLSVSVGHLDNTGKFVKTEDLFGTVEYYCIKLLTGFFPDI